MHDYFVVLRDDHDLIVRSDGAMRGFRAGQLMPFFKATKFRLEKVEDREFQIKFRSRVEQRFADFWLMSWERDKPYGFSEEEQKQFQELGMALPMLCIVWPLSDEELADIQRRARI